jgi:hypothetical protein
LWLYLCSEEPSTEKRRAFIELRGADGGIVDRRSRDE